MIVRDEEERIGVCLESVREELGWWTICDTGSTDRTKDIIIESLDGIEGKLWDRPWRNYAINRTEALRLSLGRAQYHLMLDGDMILHRHEPLPELTADEYVIHFDGGFDMGLPLLLKDGRDWSYEGVAHAYLCCGDGQPIERGILREWTIEANEEGRERSDKIRRDAELLEGELSPRTIFYLAQTYRDLGHLKEAADLFRLRVRHSASHPEEVFWACYQEGCLRLDIEGLEAGTRVLLEAYDRRPTRAEPLYMLGRAWRQNGMPRAAYLWLKEAEALPYPDDHLFVMRSIYEWGIALEMAHTLMALGERKDAIARFIALTAMGDPVKTYATNSLQAYG